MALSSLPRIIISSQIPSNVLPFKEIIFVDAGKVHKVPFSSTSIWLLDIEQTSQMPCVTMKSGFKSFRRWVFIWYRVALFWSVSRTWESISIWDRLDLIDENDTFSNFLVLFYRILVWQS